MVSAGAADCIVKKVVCEARSSSPAGRITLRAYLPNDYRLVAEWWQTAGQIPPEEVLLPKCGVLAELDGEPVGCVFVYLDNSSPVGFVCWFGLRHGLGRIGREVLAHLEAGAVVSARSQGKLWLYAASGAPAVKRVLTSAGWLPAHDATEYWLEVGLQSQRSEDGGAQCPQ
jgi:hypothetical protein